MSDGTASVYLPPFTDDGDVLGRWYDPDLWSEVYVKEREWAERKWLRWILREHQPPQLKDFPNVTSWLFAGQQDKLMVEWKRNQVLYLDPICKANAAAIRGIKMSWQRIRSLVWERDGGICQVCGLDCEHDGDGNGGKYWECGHIIDRVLGGSDRPDNLVCMCVICNQFKPLTRTRAEYVEWASKGGPARERANEAMFSLLYRLIMSCIIATVASCGCSNWRP